MLLTEQGRISVAKIAAQHGFSAEAAEVMLAALVRGNGSQAQFNHSEFGGMGQWSMGGMLMIGDMFNNALKSRVDGLASALSGLVGSASLFQPRPVTEGGLFASSSVWPAELGAPSSSGSQNDMQYAVFPAYRRLAVMQGGRLFLYDTGDHLIGGVSQQQGGGNVLQFSSQYGPVSLDRLIPVALPGAEPAAPPPVAAPISVAPQPAAANADPAPPATAEPVAGVTGVGAGSEMEEGSIFTIIEQLHRLFSRGILTQAEFDAKKAELLARL